ncbi:RING finger protein 112-like [Rhinoderma darwinii]|uniref:RING finger protein 112-like n=1 Tax=Rhinoderma darwinii TaxID=43563 RepID=UPI003F669D2C
MEARRYGEADRPQPRASLGTTQRRTEPQKKKARRRPRKNRAAGYSETAEPMSNDAPLPPDGAVSFHSLMEDITCSVCLDDLQSPVTISCGHTFCRNCISTHWSTPHPEGYLCPECRKQCPRNQIAPDYRLMNIITKIQRGMQEKNSETECPPSPEQGYPLQLVWTDENGGLHLDESVVCDCFMNRGLSDYPVYLLCVIGEKRRGKSFLMNYIMRALASQEKGEKLSLGANDEPLQGFEWKCGIDSTTKGIWMWSRPFIVGHEGEKVAVYILDTEGSLDIEGDRESCIKLSALSMLLSSHLVFNVAGSLKETELDYMEMYLHMGEELGSPGLQYLDILIRDWHDSNNCGREEAQSYIRREVEKLQKGCNYPKVLWDLERSHTRCFLLPHPGKGITGESQGRLQDMDTDFQDNLRLYVKDVVQGVWHRTKTSETGEVLTCGRVPSMLQDFVDVLNQQKFGFSSPMEMFYAIKNRKIMESTKEEFREFLKKLPNYRFPSTMQTLVSEKSAELAKKFQDSLLGRNPGHHAALQEELEAHLMEEQKMFCSGYNKRLTYNAVTLGATVGFGLYGAIGAVAAQPAVAVAEGTVAMEVVANTVAVLKTGVSALVGRFFRGGL